MGPPSLVAGETLAGRYELRARIDGLRHPFAEVWSATDRVLARAVVVEVLSPDADQPQHDAFVAALTAAARLAHPNIAATYDSGTVNGLPFLVTESTPGHLLADLVPLVPSRAAIIGRQLARAVDAAHRAGVTHGDVSPGNVMVTDDDRVKLSRFAISGAVARRSFDDDVAGFRATLSACVGDAGRRTPLRTAIDAPTLPEAISALDALAVGEPEPPPREPRSSRAPMVAGVTVALILVAGIVATAFALANGGGSGPAANGSGPVGASPVTGAARGGDLAVTAVQSFNPFGTHPENEATVDRLIDGDPSTTWSTFEYSDPRFGNLKPGTGVFLTLSKAQTLHNLTVSSPSRGWAFAVYVAATPGATLNSWGTPFAATADVTSDVTQVDLTGAEGAAILVWITNLGEPAPRTTTFPYRVDIGELAVR